MVASIFATLGGSEDTVNGHGIQYAATALKIIISLMTRQM